MVSPVKLYVEPQFRDYLKPRELSHLAELALKTCWTASMDPVAIMIRSHVHKTTSRRVRGVRVKDPDRWHVTISAKNSKTLRDGEHYTFHGYVEWQWATDVTDVSYGARKPDWIPKGDIGKQTPIRPDASKLHLLEGDDKPEVEEIYAKFCEAKLALASNTASY